MASVLGVWDLVLATPIGRMQVTAEFTGTDAALAGIARGKGEDVPLHDIAATTTEAGERVTWRQSITKPLRLNLDFDVVVTGDSLTGTSKAGRLPSTKVEGTRRVV